MKIIGLEVKGLRKLKAVELSFSKEGGLIPIKGKNEQGKSTVLDAIEMIMKGRNAFTKDMISHGEDAAKLVGFFDDFTVIRKIIDDKDYLEIRNLEGLKIDKTPQAFLNKFINELTFNPRPFLDKKTEDKVKFMMDLLNIDFSEEELEIKRASDERLIVGRQIKSLGALAPVPKTDPVDLSEAIKFNNEQNQRKSALENAQWHLDSIITDISELKEKLANLEQRKKEGEEHIAKLPKPEKEKDISAAEDQNKKANAYRLYLKESEKKRALENSYEAFTKAINAFKAQKLKKLREAKMPVKGLELKEEGIYYNGIHCENWSKSQANRVSLELCIAMNPGLKSVFIDDGENYDSDGLKELESWAKENDIQVFIAIVQDIPEELEEGVFYIENGVVKEK